MSGSQAQTKVSNGEFSIIQISDPQHLSSMHPSCWPQLTSWIVTNAADYNLKMVVLTGDIVDDGTYPSQWSTANTSMCQLIQADIPYTWDAGNHDQNGNGPDGNPDGDWLGSQYLAFNAAYLHSKPYWVSDINNGKNTAVQFSYGNYSVLIINLEFHANSTAINWMINLIETHPNSHIIVATHSYLNGLLGYGFPYSANSPEWEDHLRTILDKYPNVFLTLSGHYIHTIHPAGDEETSNYTRINTREETFFNRQMAHGDGGTGADSVRIFTFNVTNPNNATIHVSTYDVYSDVWKNDSWNLFTFMEHTKGAAYNATATNKSTDSTTNAGQATLHLPITSLHPNTSPLKTPCPTSTPSTQPSVTPSPTTQSTATTNSEAPATPTQIMYFPLTALAVVTTLAILMVVIRHSHKKANQSVKPPYEFNKKQVITVLDRNKKVPAKFKKASNSSSKV